MTGVPRPAAVAVLVLCLAGIAPPTDGHQIPRLIPMTGLLTVPAGPTLVVFAIYSDQASDTPVWRERQQVDVAPDGRYAVSLGAATPGGVPVELFATGEARWLGVRVEGQPELPRVALLSVPYALKAADADTVGGKPISAFVLAGDQTGTGPDGLTYVNTALLGRSLAGGVGAGGASSGTPGYLGLFTTTTDLGNSVVFQSAERIGVGTTDPQAAFHAVATAAPGTFFDVFSGSLGALPVVYRAARGTPGSPAAVQTNDILGGLAVRGHDGTQWSGGRGQVMFKAAENWAPGLHGTYLSFATMPTGGIVTPAPERMRITPDGKVGIGTSTPGQALSVAGTIESTSGGVKFPDGTTQSTALSLGTNTFTATQTISSGNLALPATTGASSGVLTLGGQSYLHGYGSTTHANTFLGPQAGSFTIVGTGGNVGLGPSALGSVGSGYYNTAVGTSSLANLTTGDSNTAVGYQTLRLVTNGQFNTAVGRSALASVAVRNANTAVGYKALNFATGSDNSAFGSMALAGATAASENSVFGSLALAVTSTGQQNSAFGYEAMRLNEAGDGNSAFGHASLKYAKTANFNTAVGLDAGRNLTTGSLNTFVGYMAGTDAASPALTNATAIGANATVTKDNSLVLGATDVYVGIGTSAPNTKLHVVGDIRVGVSMENMGCVKNFNGTHIAGTCSSDARLKTNITPFEPVLARFVRLQPVRFDWRTKEFPDYRFGAARNAGLIAQQVEQVFPELVATDANGYKMVNYTELPYLTVAAVRELKAENDALKARLDALEQAHQRLLEALARLEKRRP